MQTLARSGVEPALNGKYSAIGDDIEVGAFRQESTDETVGVFDRPFFPEAIRMTEERQGMELAVDFFVKSVFDAIVVSDGAAQGKRQRIEDIAQSGKGALSGFIFDFGDAGEAGLAVNGDFEGGVTFADDGVDFPMTCLGAQVGGLGPV